MHTFELEIRWTGSTATKDYSRDGVAQPTGKSEVPISTAPVFGGNEAYWNPEDLLGASLSNCHMQTFLALAAKVGIDVRSYTDRVESIVDTVDKVTQVTKITLRPTIVISAESDPAKAEKFFHKAHKYCFVGQSLKSEVVMEPTIEVADAA